MVNVWILSEPEVVIVPPVILVVLMVFVESLQSARPLADARLVPTVNEVIVPLPGVEMADEASQVEADEQSEDPALAVPLVYASTSASIL